MKHRCRFPSLSNHLFSLFVQRNVREVSEQTAEAEERGREGGREGDGMGELGETKRSKGRKERCLQAILV